MMRKRRSHSCTVPKEASIQKQEPRPERRGATKKFCNPGRLRTGMTNSALQLRDRPLRWDRVSGAERKARKAQQRGSLAIDNTLVRDDKGDFDFRRVRKWNAMARSSTAGVFAGDSDPGGVGPLRQGRMRVDQRAGLRISREMSASPQTRDAVGVRAPKRRRPETAHTERQLKERSSRENSDAKAWRVYTGGPTGLEDKTTRRGNFSKMQDDYRCACYHPKTFDDKQKPRGWKVRLRNFYMVPLSPKQIGNLDRRRSSRGTARRGNKRVADLDDEVGGFGVGPTCFLWAVEDLQKDLITRPTRNLRRWADVMTGCVTSADERASNDTDNDLGLVRCVTSTDGRASNNDVLGLDRCMGNQCITSTDGRASNDGIQRWCWDSTDARRSAAIHQWRASNDGVGTQPMRGAWSRMRGNEPPSNDGVGTRQMRGKPPSTDRWDSSDARRLKPHCADRRDSTDTRPAAVPRLVGLNRSRDTSMSSPGNETPAAKHQRTVFIADRKACDAREKEFDGPERVQAASASAS
ncbi:hypothetical protein C8R47DRAFT_1082738 [Mycena vitilis]|nr:hypothetical protein C8R47DRAFT_1082738 [Mycena vitilis]